MFQREIVRIASYKGSITFYNTLSRQAFSFQAINFLSFHLWVSLSLFVRNTLPFVFLEASTDNSHPSTLAPVLISVKILGVLWIATKPHLQHLKNDNAISEGNTWKEAVRRKEVCTTITLFKAKIFPLNHCCLNISSTNVVHHPLLPLFWC